MCIECLQKESVVMVSGRRGIVVCAVDVVVLALEEFSSGYFSACIFWLNGVFKLEGINS